MLYGSEYKKLVWHPKLFWEIILLYEMILNKVLKRILSKWYNWKIIWFLVILLDGDYGWLFGEEWDNISLIWIIGGWWSNCEECNNVNLIWEVVIFSTKWLANTYFPLMPSKHRVCSAIFYEKSKKNFKKASRVVTWALVCLPETSFTSGSAISGGWFDLILWTRNMFYFNCTLITYELNQCKLDKLLHTWGSRAERKKTRCPTQRNRIIKKQNMFFSRW